jgi:molecular chaperone DnaK
MNPRTREVEMVQDELSGSHLIPSVLVFDDTDTYRIGQAALNEAGVAPDRTVRSIKRLLGYTHERQFGERVFSATELAALIIRKLIQLAERKLYRDTEVCYEIRKAIVMVPANYFDLQISSLLDACRGAGLDIEVDSTREAARVTQENIGKHITAGIVLDEPTAAALYYVDFLRRRGTVKGITQAIGSNDGLKLRLLAASGG